MGIIESMLGSNGSEVKCNKFIHWYASPRKPGAKCICGEQQIYKKPKKKNPPSSKEAAGE